MKNFVCPRFPTKKWKNIHRRKKVLKIIMFYTYKRSRCETYDMHCKFFLHVIYRIEWKENLQCYFFTSVSNYALLDLIHFGSIHIIYKHEKIPIFLFLSVSLTNIHLYCVLYIFLFLWYNCLKYLPILGWYYLYMTNWYAYTQKG